MTELPQDPAQRAASAPFLLATMKKRSDFLRMRGRNGASRASFILVARPRGDDDSTVRVGYTVTKKIGGAVERNRIKRRLKEAVRRVFPAHAVAGHDYVFIARRKALGREFTILLDDVRRALLSLHGETK